MPKTPKKVARKSAVGRPTRDQEIRRVIAAAGVDPALVDPRRVLAAIAVDPSAPASARVAAARALLAVGAGVSQPAPAIGLNELTDLDKHTLKIIARRMN